MGWSPPPFSWYHILMCYWQRRRNMGRLRLWLFLSALVFQINVFADSPSYDTHSVSAERPLGQSHQTVTKKNSEYCDAALPGYYNWALWQELRHNPVPFHPKRDYSRTLKSFCLTEKLTAEDFVDFENWVTTLSAEVRQNIQPVLDDCKQRLRTNIRAKYPILERWERELEKQREKFIQQGNKPDLFIPDDRYNEDVPEKYSKASAQADDEFNHSPLTS